MESVFGSRVMTSLCRSNVACATLLEAAILGSQNYQRWKKQRDKENEGVGRHSVVNAKDQTGPRGEICDCSDVMELASMVTEADQEAVMP